MYNPPTAADGRGSASEKTLQAASVDEPSIVGVLPAPPFSCIVFWRGEAKGLEA